MRNKILVIGAVAFVAYAVGTRAGRVTVNKGESVPHQLVRLWDAPRARKRRKEAAAAAAKKAKKALDRARR
jgi:hypothetical protein